MVIPASLAARCAIVGGGPAGMVLAYLLGRAGVEVVLLESHLDFDRAFRGDTVHPSTLDLFEQIGLLEKLLAIPHAKLRRMRMRTPTDDFVLIDFSVLKTRHPYIALIPQSELLDLLAAECNSLPNVRIVLGAAARSLLCEKDRVVGVGYRAAEGEGTLRAELVVAADGRHSVLRKEAGFEQTRTAAPMDVVWFVLPKSPGDPPPDEGLFRIARGRLLVTIDRADHWQIAYVIPKGGFHKLKEAGLETFRESVAEVAPNFKDRMGTVGGWGDVSVLVVESGRLPTWHLPGLLFIGDAAHTMSPVGGVGINYAIQDAVCAHNLLAGPLRKGSVTPRDLAAVQKRREPSVRFIQAVQRMIQKKLVSEAIDPRRSFRPPWFLHFGPIQRFLAWSMGFGYHPSRLESAAWPK